MPERNCVRHHDRPAVAQCFQCHRPICEECRFKEARAGVFCSQECYDQHVAYVGRKQAVIKQGGGLKSMVIGLVFLAAIVLAAVYIGGGKMNLPILNKLYKMIF